MSRISSHTPGVRVVGAQRHLASEGVGVSSDCRKRGDAVAATDAAERARMALLDVLSKWPVDKGATFFITVTVDSDGNREIHGVPPT